MYFYLFLCQYYYYYYYYYYYFIFINLLLYYLLLYLLQILCKLNLNLTGVTSSFLIVAMFVIVDKKNNTGEITLSILCVIFI
jgi:hypothetical protein